ncbi:hypothetical protein HanRHA438_Chr01g0019101 [Helianthus annuus]|nr:hypothetical protein HanHA300_Chr01g0014991 [Helianthus annuus]KAJ0626679.1 hypothetical protein HanHA89_Chr01g0016611 [Helianthus annuus]KAJ0783026.1 hypothetical protein HanLR1_Chr01g0015541 [Helianthus annuus]KAJ0947725.1 hypothetical protein HanRHA438_Chr01g0019101 [Helianthus annuus]
MGMTTKLKGREMENGKIGIERFKEKELRDEKVSGHGCSAAAPWRQRHCTATMTTSDGLIGHWSSSKQYPRSMDSMAARRSLSI